MYCPFCGHIETKVTDSRLAGEGRQIRRRRECLSCGERFTTFETAELVMPVVVKGDRNREAYDEAKVRSGMEKALEKRPVPRDQLDEAVSRITHKVRSLGEREVQAPEERALVSAVVYNRLHAGMPLGLDATLRYGLAIPATQDIRASQLADGTPYNTRLHTGLPPTPIANPGLAAIRAAAHPANVDYLYFVRRPDEHRHFFTASPDRFYAYECAHGYGC